MSILELVSLALAAVLGVYLVVALLKPELFQ
jgi:K+-transporting ATPase KdpF subunit